jgi:hypothetical protein
MFYNVLRNFRGTGSFHEQMQNVSSDSAEFLKRLASTIKGMKDFA